MGRLRFYGDMIREDPLNFVLYILSFAVALLVSLILHECAHAYVALRCGDPTAKMLGRLSLRPSRHLTLMGTASMLLIGVGWAKPVPVNPNHFKNYRRDDFLVSIAGIVTNYTLFLISVGMAVLVNRWIWTQSFYQNVASTGDISALINPYENFDEISVGLYIMYFGQSVFNNSVIANGWLLQIQRFLLLMAQMNLGLAVFNFLPIPPLDGFHILNDVILRGKLRLNGQTFVILQVAVILLIFTGVLDPVLTTMNQGIFSAFVHLFVRIWG